MVTYAQQTDPNKARISSIDTTQVIDTKPVEKPVETPIDTQTVETATTKPVVENKAPEFIGEPKTATKKTTTQQPITTEQAPDWIGQPFVNNAKIVEQKAQAQAVETSKRLATTNASVIATDYKNGGVSAMELQALKESDPLKFQEVSLALEKQNTLDAINMNQEQFLTNYQKLTDTYMQARESMLNDTTGQELRQQVFEQYGLNKSNDMIKSYTTQIDKIDDELRNLEDWTGTGDAMMDRGELVRKGRDLSRQRMDAVRARQAEVDYYRLGLEQADAVVKDYKEAQGLRMGMMEKQFEIATGMSTMEFEMKDQQNRDYLKELDLQRVELKEDEKEQKAFEAEQIKKQQDTVLNASLLSLYDNFSEEEKTVLMGLPSESIGTLLKTVDAQAKADAEAKMDAAKMDWEKYKFGIEQGAKKNQYKPVNIKVDGKDVTVLVNDKGDIKPMNTDFIPGEVPNIKPTGVKGGQCGAYVNRSIPGMSPSGKWFGDTLSEKMKLVDSAVPVVGGAVVMDYGQIDPATGKNYGHVGVVTGINADGTINVSDSNVNLDEVVSNRTLSKSEMQKVVGYMIPPVPKQSILDGLSTFKFGLTKEESGVFEESINNLIEDGDIESIKTNLRDAYMTKLTAGEQEKIRSRYVVADMTQTLLQNIENYVDQGGDTGIFTGSKEQMLNKIGKTSNKEIASLQTQIVDLIDKISRDRSGAALTEEEIQLYTSILPGVGKSMEYNRGVVEGLLQSVKNQDKYIDQEISKRVTGKAKDFIYPPSWDQKDFAEWLQKGNAQLVD